MDTEMHKQVVKDLLDAFNAGKLEPEFSELLDAKMVYHHGGSVDGKPEWLRDAKACRVSFPDARNDIISQTAEGDKLVTLYEFSGTHLAPFGKYAATGKSFRVEGKLTTKIENGLLTDVDDAVDGAALMQQLGLAG